MCVAMKAGLTSKGLRCEMRLPGREVDCVETSPLSMPTSLVVQMSLAGPQMIAPVSRPPWKSSLRYSGALRPHGRVDLGRGVVPLAERGHVEMTDLDDVHDEAAPIGDVAARHVGADHAPVLLRGGLDGVDLGHRR